METPTVFCQFEGKRYAWSSDRFYLDEIEQRQKSGRAHDEGITDNDVSGGIHAKGDSGTSHHHYQSRGTATTTSTLASSSLSRPLLQQQQPSFSPYFSRRALVESLVGRGDLLGCVLMTYSCRLSSVKAEFPTLLATEVPPAKQVPVLLLHGDKDWWGLQLLLLLFFAVDSLG
jgi:hypothetical protein